MLNLLATAPRATTLSLSEQQTAIEEALRLKNEQLALDHTCRQIELRILILWLLSQRGQSLSCIPSFAQCPLSNWAHLSEPQRASLLFSVDPSEIQATLHFLQHNPAPTSIPLRIYALGIDAIIDLPIDFFN